MFEILRAIKNIIERYIVNKTPLRSSVSSGSSSISVQSTRRFCTGDVIVIYHKESDDAQTEGEVHTVTEVPDRYTLTIDTPLVSNYTVTNSFVEKMIGFSDGTETFLDAVYIGDPEVIPRYPAITVNARTRSEDWLTLESTKRDFDIDITVYVLAADYESQYELMCLYAQSIENALFRSLYPLVEPYDYTILTQDVLPSDTIIQVEDVAFAECGGGFIFLESYDFLKSNQIYENLGGGTIRLSLPAGASFSAGDKLIRPKRHIYNSIPASTSYGNSFKSTMLKSAVISYKCSEEVLRHQPYIDPLTF